jgi:putative transposase
VRRQFREGSAELGIIPRYDRRGGVSRRRADAEVLQIIHDLIDTQILCPVPKSVRQLHEATQREIGSRNCTRAEGGKLKIPSYATVRRIVREYSPYEIMVAQRGRAAADAHFRWGREKFRPERLLQEVQVDNTVFDAIAVDDDGKTIGRPTLTVVLETRNRVVLGRYLGFEPASWRTVMRALCHAILPKPQTLPEVAQSNSWKMYGRFETLVMDNGKEFLSNAMHKAAIELGFQLSYCARKRPWAKGAVERFFRTLNTGLIHRLPGTTFSNPAQRGAYDSKGEARLTLGQMRVLLDKWIVEEYHQRIHRTLGITPAQSWEISAQSWPPRLPASAWAVRTAFGNPLRCKVDHSGIKLHVNQHYNSENLGSLRRQLGTELELDVKYFPEDISSIGVRDPISNQYIEVPNTDPVYSGGLSLEQHELLRRRDGTGTTALKGQLPVSMDIDAAVQSSVEFTAKQRAAMQGSSEPNLPLGGNETPRNSAARMKQQLEKRIQSLLKSQEGVEPQTLEVTHV